MKELARIWVTPEFKKVFKIKKAECGEINDSDFSNKLAEYLKDCDVSKDIKRRENGFRFFK